jgi:hypothetical protein
MICDGAFTAVQTGEEVLGRSAAYPLAMLPGRLGAHPSILPAVNDRNGNRLVLPGRHTKGADLVPCSAWTHGGAESGSRSTTVAFERTVLEALRDSAGALWRATAGPEPATAGGPGRAIIDAVWAVTGS